MNRRILQIISLAVVVFVVAGQTGIASAQGGDLVLDQQFIEIDGIRPVGLSPDGRWLAASDFGMSELCVYDAITIAVQSCTSLEPLEAGLRLEDVVWSPDSTRLALAEQSFVYFKDGDLWVMDAMTGELTNVADDGFTGNFLLEPESGAGAFSYDVAPAWTPDGAMLSFSRSTWVDGEFRGNDIVMIPAGGGEPESLTMVSEGVPGVAYLGMEWTADGEHLYYSVLSPDADDPANGIYRYDRDDGSTRQVLSPSPESGPPAVLQVNATDTHVLIWYPYGAGSFERDKPLYWLFGVGTGDVTPLEVPVPDDAGIGWIVAATFSPDGQSLLTATRNTTPDAQLWVTDLESGEQTLLVESLPGAMVMEYSLTLSWTASGRIFVPANIGSGTLLTVEAVDMPEVGTPIAGAVDPAATPATDWAGVTVGEVLQVTSAGVPLHAAPSATAPAVLLLDQGAEVRVIGPSEEAEDILWIPVQDEATRTIGFVRAEFLSAENP